MIIHGIQNPNDRHDLLLHAGNTHEDGSGVGNPRTASFTRDETLEDFVDSSFRLVGEYQQRWVRTLIIAYPRDGYPMASKVRSY